MKKSVLIIIGVIVVLIILFAAMYNGIVKSEEEVNSKYAGIETDLQRRTDLIPNLVSTVKQYAEHESEVFKQVNESREKLMGASSPEDLASADAEMTSSLNKLLAISEAYPELKSNENFINLQDELAGTENRIAVSRKDYNESVKTYNASIKTFPKVIFANMFVFDEKEYFEASKGAENVPSVNFE